MLKLASKKTHIEEEKEIPYPFKSKEFKNDTILIS